MLSLAAPLATSAGHGLALMLAVPAAGVAAVVLVLAVAAGKWMRSDRTQGKWLTESVRAGSAWSTSDSWATNISAVGAALGGVTSSTNLLSPLIPAAADASLTGLWIMLGGTAAIAPIVYGALAKNPTSAIGSVGTRAGLFLAAMVTLFAAFGDLATLAYVGVQLHVATGEQVALVAAAVLAAVAVGTYAARTLWLMADPAAAAGNRGSLLSTPAKTSGTL